MKPLVYLAGPITVPEPMENTHIALREADVLLIDAVVLPFVPHLTCLWQMISPHSYEDWLAYDFDVIQHCDALYRLPGESRGADREVVFANNLGLPVFVDRDDLYTWARSDFPAQVA